MDKVISWSVPIVAPSARSLELVDLRVGRGGLELNVREEEGRDWTLRFHPIQAIRLTTEECAGTVLGTFAEHGGFFQVANSSWIEALGGAKVRFLERSRHFIVSCYDEVVEVVAWDCEIAPRQ